MEAVAKLVRTVIALKHHILSWK